MEIGSREKKLFALIVLSILIITAGFLSMGTDIFNPEDKQKKEEIAKPYVMPPNIPVTTKEGDNNEPTIAINPKDTDNMVAGSNDYNTPEGDSWCGYYTTHDGGKTWKSDLLPGYPGDPRSSALTGYEGAGDPVIMADGDGNFYYAGIAFKRALWEGNPTGFGLRLGTDNCIFVAKSTNGGDSFDQVVVVWSAYQSVARFNDKEWIGVDPNNGNIYIAWAIFTGMVTSRLMFSRSTDGGLSWSIPITVSETTGLEINIQGAALVVDDDSNVHLTWIDFGGNQVRYAKSTDQGQSFNSPADVSPIDPIPRQLDNGNYRTPTMTMLAVDRSNEESNGNLYVTWADHSNNDADTFLSYSHDNGNSWEGPVRVNNDTVGNGKDQFFPAVSVSKEGWVHVTFYDRRNDSSNTLLEYWWAVSFDEGKTFPLNFPVSDASFNGDHSREGDNDFIGDYTTVVTENNTLACVWCDTREGSEEQGDSEIYSAIFDYYSFLTTNDIGYDIPIKEK